MKEILDNYTAHEVVYYFKVSYKKFKICNKNPNPKST